MNEEMLLEARGISKYFPGVQALDGVDFQLNRGTIHALCGENGAGKSTLMNILIGFYRKDSGEILVRGKPVELSSPRQALHLGISIIEQELNFVPAMTVAENMFLGREPSRAMTFIDYRELNRLSGEYLSRLGVDIDPKTMMSRLSLAQVQLVEIAKALSRESAVLFMDEPTSALGEREVEQLFTVLRTLRREGTGIVYVSHKLDEIFSISDEVTVLRDGKQVGSKLTSELGRAELVKMMVGRTLEEKFIKDNTPGEEEMLTVQSYSKKAQFSDISLSVRRGEVLGIYGLVGAGRSEFLDALFGVTAADGGSVLVEGREVSINSPADAKRVGIAYVTEDRKSSGLVLTSSVKENITITALREISRGLFLSPRMEREVVQNLCDRLRIKTPSIRQTVKNLSGGNQQKVVLAKWLVSRPRILVLDEPTRGIDVGAKQEIYRLISDFAKEGLGIIVVSSEMPEILGICDRIVVFRRGRISGQLSAGEATQEQLMHLAS